MPSVHLLPSNAPTLFDTFTVASPLWKLATSFDHRLVVIRSGSDVITSVGECSSQPVAKLITVINQ